MGGREGGKEGGREAGREIEREGGREGAEGTLGVESIGHQLEFSIRRYE